MSNITKDRRVYLGMPGYGRATAEASMGFWRACADMSQVNNYYRAGSLLASNFNQLWCWALNDAREGKRVDYFAMLHDDIGPMQVGNGEHWLDILIDELEANNLDVLGVAVPIKDQRGITSMAVGRGEEGDDGWLPHCRLSMHDVYQLPQTFTSDDIGRPIWLNTGCWVCKFNPAWAEMVHFEIRDRIVFNTATNRYQAQTIPEDWHFSQQLHEIGTGPSAHLPKLRIGCTTKVKLRHKGDIDFHNMSAWGTCHIDPETSISPVPGAFPGEIPGWLTEVEAKRLEELARGKRVLEIGSYCGLSTVVMGRVAAHVTAVDYFDGRGTPHPANTKPTFDNSISRYGLQGKVEAVHPDAELPLPKYDLVFIDGDHDYESVRIDIGKAKNVLAEGGLIAFHDFDHPSHRGVREAVEELLLAYGGEIISVQDSLAVVNPSAAIPLEV